MELFQIIFRTTFFYIFIVLVYRIMGKREIGQLGLSDLIVTILIAELAAISIENLDSSMILSVVAVLILVALELISAFIGMKSKRFKEIIDGKPSLIICNGKINYKEMVKIRYSLDNLLLSLREQKIKSIDEIEYAFLETNGKLSLFKYENEFKKKSAYPMPIILDSMIQEDVLGKINKTKSWILNELDKKELELENIVYAFFKDKKLFIIKKDDLYKKN